MKNINKIIISITYRLKICFTTRLLDNIIIIMFVNQNNKTNKNANYKTIEKSAKF